VATPRALVVAVTEDPWNEPGEAVDEDQRRQLAAGQDIVPDGDRLMDERLPHSLIYPLIVAADDDEVFEARQALCERRRERLALRTHEDGPAVASCAVAGCARSRMSAGAPDGFHRLEHRLRLHDHAGTAPIRSVIDRPTLVMRVVAEVVHADPQPPARLGPLHDRTSQYGREHLRKDRDDVNLHQFRICVSALLRDA